MRLTAAFGGVAASIVIGAACNALAQGSDGHVALRDCRSGGKPQWIDTQVHVPGRRGKLVDIPAAVAEAAGVMAANQICSMILMPVPGVPGAFPPQVLEDFLPLARKHPEHFFIMGGGGTLNAMLHTEGRDGRVAPDVIDRFVKRAEAILASGAVGFGEIGALHLAPFPGQQFENTPADHPLLLALADVTARHDAVIDLHIDLVEKDMDTPKGLPQPANPPRLQSNLAGLERLLGHNRKARIVWAHLGSDFLGFRTPSLTRRMLQAHPNLFMSLRLGPGRVPSNHPMTESGIKPEWMKLFEDFADRFVIGTDQIFSMRGGPLTAQHEKQRAVVRQQTNRFLSYLPSKLARQIASENAIRIYRLDR